MITPESIILTLIGAWVASKGYKVVKKQTTSKKTTVKKKEVKTSTVDHNGPRFHIDQDGVIHQIEFPSTARLIDQFAGKTAAEVEAQIRSRGK
jgi:hypothetical protein